MSAKKPTAGERELAQALFAAFVKKERIAHIMKFRQLPEEIKQAWYYVARRKLRKILEVYT